MDPAMAEGIDWPALMRAGMHRLGLRPDQFWALSPVELTLMLGSGAAISPLGRERLEELERLYGEKERNGDG